LITYWYPALPLEELKPSGWDAPGQREHKLEIIRAAGGPDLIASIRELGQLDYSIARWVQSNVSGRWIPKARRFVYVPLLIGKWMLEPGGTRWHVLKHLGIKTQKVKATGPAQYHWDYERFDACPSSGVETKYTARSD
jgi:hypothetical protein